MQIKSDLELYSCINFDMITFTENQQKLEKDKIIYCSYLKTFNRDCEIPLPLPLELIIKIFSFLKPVESGLIRSVCYQWSTIIPPNTQIMQRAFINFLMLGNLHCAKYALHNGCKMCMEPLQIMKIVKHGFFDCIKFIFEKKKCLDVFKKATECEYPLDRHICGYTAKFGHLEILKLARKNGCP